MKSFGNQVGVTLIELIVSIGIASVSVLLLGSAISGFYKQQQKLLLMTNAGLTRLMMVSNIENSVAWQNTVSNLTNTTMDCLRNSTNCSGGGSFRLISSSVGTIVYDGATSTSGFTSDGQLCNAYSATTGNDNCPLQIDLQWQPLCAPLPCRPSQVKVTGDLRYNPLSADKKSLLKVSRYRFEVYRDVENLKVTSLAAGALHTCIVLQGAVKCVGKNSFDSFGAGAPSNSSLFLNINGMSSGVQSLEAAIYHSCALVQFGVKCWGWNDVGQLGNGTNVRALNPVGVTGLSAGVKTLSTTGYHGCALLLNGAVRCWGSNSAGQLGNASFADSNSPVNVSGLASGVTSISAGQFHTCAIFSGALKCWGWNRFGQLGNGTTVNSSIPVDVTGMTSGVTAVSAGRAHTCAIINGAAKCWGLNFFNQLGNGPPFPGVNSAVPVDVIGLSAGITSVAASGYKTCAILDTGAVKCWGDKRNGQAGFGYGYVVGVSSSYSHMSPVDVIGLAGTPRAQSLASGPNHTCVLLDTGNVKCWGYNSYSQLGTGTTTDSSPFPTDLIY